MFGFHFTKHFLDSFQGVGTSDRVDMFGTCLDGYSLCKQTLSCCFQDRYSTFTDFKLFPQKVVDISFLFNFLVWTFKKQSVCKLQESVWETRRPSQKISRSWWRRPSSQRRKSKPFMRNFWRYLQSSLQFWGTDVPKKNAWFLSLSLISHKSTIFSGLSVWPAEQGRVPDCLHWTISSWWFRSGI